MIHVTGRNRFKHCPRQYKFAYIDELQPNTKSRGPGWFGTGLHYALANWYQSIKIENVKKTPTEYFQDWWVAETKDSLMTYPQDVQIKIMEYYALGECMLDGYSKQYTQDSQWAILHVEEAFKHDNLVGTFDLVIQDHKGMHWIVDHKGYGRLRTVEQFYNEDQGLAYCYLYEKATGIRPAGIIYNQLWKKVPAEPKQIYLGKPNEGLSRDKSIVTTTEIYINALNKYGYNVAEYEDVLTRIADYHFYERVAVRFAPREIDIFAKYITKELQIINTSTYDMYNLSDSCTVRCAYYDLCKCMRTGSDLQAMINFGFHKESVSHGSDVEVEE